MARAVVATSAAVTSAAIAWAVFTVAAASRPQSPDPDFVTATASTGTVQDSLPVRAEATWTQRLVARNAAPGVVTSVDVREDRPTVPGDVLYTVDLAPVVVGQGEVPAFRELSEGDTGRDVKQLQALLRSVGTLRGPADGTFGRATRAAVLAWQKRAGIDPTGVVTLGSVVFVPTLPATLRTDGTVLSVGAQVSGGEPVLQQVAESPTISATLPSDAVGRVEVGAPVQLDGDDLGRVASVDAQSDGSSVARIDCERACPLNGGLDSVPLRLSILVVPRTTGVVVPTAALRSAAESVYVTDADGTRHRVEVLATASGRSVVRGVEVGTRVRISDERGQ